MDNSDKCSASIKTSENGENKRNANFNLTQLILKYLLRDYANN